MNFKCDEITQGFLWQLSVSGAEETDCVLIPRFQSPCSCDQDDSDLSVLGHYAVSTAKIITS